jgi:hypothetical protein
MKKILVTTAVATVLALAGCGGSDEGSSADEQDQSSKEVTSADYGDEWPLTVDSGTLACDGDAVTFTAGGKTYAVNGMATTRSAGVDIEPIWADNPEVEGTKKSIGVLINDGLALC